METIHIVEPTLTTEIGHCYSFINSLCLASRDVHLSLWVNRVASVSFNNSNVQIKQHFYRKIRRLQCYFLYKNLLRSPDKLFISTASVSDLLLLNWAAHGIVREKKAYLYFHWLNMSERKFSRLKKLAQQQPHLEILGPTASVVHVFKEAGFKNAHLVPYPVASQRLNISEHKQFEALLYAGAARQDKGITHVVDLLKHINNLGLQIPFKLQNSGNHHGEYDAATQADMQRLDKINYPYLQCISETLSAKEYDYQFSGAICIQLYNPTLFADRISGVTLDALSAGSPIVTTADSWIARMVKRFDAGLVVENPAPETVLEAIQKIMADYTHYQKNAIGASLTLQRENSAEFLFETLIEK
jgi:glycosyltransferase involved in cell wall biosynthesis